MKAVQSCGSGSTALRIFVCHGVASNVCVIGAFLPGMSKTPKVCQAKLVSSHFFEKSMHMILFQMQDRMIGDG